MNEKMKNSRSRWFGSWVVLLCDVFLFAAALNCLFRWMSYGKPFDGAALALSLVLALTVYFLALKPERIASLQKRMLVAVASLAIWAALLPMVMRLTGYN